MTKPDEAQNMARLSASEVACYRWPEDTTEHRALRAAFMDGAAHICQINRVDDSMAKQLQRSMELNAVLRKEFEIARTASHLFERASNDWMERALRAEALLNKF